MKDGLIKTAAGTPSIELADCRANASACVQLAREAAAQDVRLLVLPELCLTGYTCGDLFFQSLLEKRALEALNTLAEETAHMSMVTVAGLPMAREGKLYNCAAVLYRGKVLGVVPKTHIPNYGEFYEARQFVPAPAETGAIDVGGGKSAPFGSRLLFRCLQMPEFTFAVEICEDLWAVDPPSSGAARAGAVILLNLSASDETVGKSDYRRALVAGQSARLLCGYVYADAGQGESTTDMVFAGHNLIAENGVTLAESRLFTTGLTVSEIDVQRLSYERRRVTVFHAAGAPEKEYTQIPFSIETEPGPTCLTRRIDAHPFLPDDGQGAPRCEEILSIQAQGLARRLVCAHARSAVIGVSGGLDSALALLAAARAMDALGRPRGDILAVTMPCFGTTGRTYNNACALCAALGVSLLKIPIQQAVRRHFADIGQDEETHDVTYENAQARERTQVLMDLANKNGGIVVGTGDLSELALGWATYNGDHMSMYAVNSSVPKTLVRRLVLHEAQAAASESVREVLRDILDTPVSPELLPVTRNADGAGKEIRQKTEDLVGPYELHDFFLYYIVRWGFAPRKVYRFARYAFAEAYESAEILHWLGTFYRRFFSQQFKRSCLPDGPKIGSVSLSPRGDWRMPSDACARLWLDEIERLKKETLGVE